MKKIVSPKIKKAVLLGNEAIVRGALEAGVEFVSTYPGTPASEIGNTFYLLQNSPYKIKNLHFEFSTNEKVALEAGMGASFSGLRTLVAMKNFGLNVALDALGPFSHIGTKGATVIVVADDPSCHSSAQFEENTRALAYLLHLPFLEPSDPQEAKEFTKLGFEISEKFSLPVIIRTTTRVAHQRMIVRFSSLKKRKGKGKFLKDYHRFVTMPPRVLAMKKELLEKIKKIKKISEEKTTIDFPSSSSKWGIVTSGISYLYVRESLEKLNLKVPILKVNFFYPLPETKIKNFIKNKKKVLVVEELEPYLEREIRIIAKDINPKLQVLGKSFFPEIGEILPEMVLKAIAKLSAQKIDLRTRKISVEVAKRYPRLCPNCPYWLVFSALKRVVDPKKVIFGGDIGCYMIFGLPPISLQDYLACMGSSVGIAHGIKKATNQKLIALIGDSTFFHAGIPALINTRINNSAPLIIIMNNEITAMTGHQPYPGKKISIEKLVASLGIKNLKVIDPINQKEFVNTLKEFLNQDEVGVIIAKRPCVFVKK